jgi:hypothetical protein
MSCSAFSRAIISWNFGRLSVVVAERPGSTYSPTISAPSSAARRCTAERWAGSEMPSGS